MNITSEKEYVSIYFYPQLKLQIMIPQLSKFENTKYIGLS